MPIQLCVIMSTCKAFNSTGESRICPTHVILSTRYACFMGKNQTPEHRFWSTRSSIKHWNITVDGNTVEQVDNFIYLGSTQSSNGGSQADASHCSCVISHVFSATSLEGSIPLATDEDPGIRNASFTRASVRLRDMDHTRCRWMTSRGFPYEVPTPNNQDPLARSHQELRGRSAHRSRSGVGSHHTPPELRLRSHCQAFWRHASPPSIPESCRSDSWPSPRPKLEASPRPSQQPMDWPATQGQQQHATSWPVEKIHHTWSFGSDATVLDDYALTTTTTNIPL